MMNVRELKEKLRGLDDNLLVVIEDTSTWANDDGSVEDRDAYTLVDVQVIELYPGTDALMLGADTIGVPVTR